jgi:nucleotide-binding universal stress UspA family protein
MYAKILVPMDGSDASTLALNEAVQMAKEHGSKLRLLHIVKAPMLDYGFSTADLSRRDVVATLNKIGQRILNNAETTVREGGLNAECMLFESIEGSVAHVILDQAKQWPADLIVMGTHPRDTLIGVGRDTAEVLCESPTPVLLVRETSLPTATNSHRPLDYASGLCSDGKMAVKSGCHP